jgi:exosortase A
MRRELPRDPLIVPGAAVASLAGKGRLAALLVAAAIVLLALAYWPTLRGMAEIWSRSETFAHGFVVPLISVWIAWRERASLAGVSVRPSLLALLPVAFAGFAWLLGELAEVNALRQFAFVGMLVLAIPAIAGADVTRRLAFPLGFLFFAVPFGEFMLPQLMEWTATFTVAALKFSGVPVYREGLNFIIPSGKWSVVEACSGVRYLIASVMVGTLFAHLSYRSTARRLAFVGISIAVPLLANWLRAYMIVMLGHLSGNQIAVGVDHLIYGWAFFGVVMALMFWIGSRWREDGTPAPTVPHLHASGATVRRSADAAALGVATALFLTVALAPLLANRALDASVSAAAPVPASMADITGWTANPSGSTSWRPRYQQPSFERQQAFSREGRDITVYVAYYRNQSRESKLVSSENLLVPSSDKYWSASSAGTASPRSTFAPPEVRTADVAGRGGERLRVWHWFWVDGQWTASPTLAKALTARARLTGRGDDSAVVVLSTGQGSEPGAAGEADSALAAFVDAASGPLANALRATRDRR